MSASLANVSPVAAKQQHLKLVSGGVPAQRLTLATLIHFIYVFLPHLCLTLPFSLFYNHVIKRFTSRGIVAATGRPAFADYVVTLTRYYLSRTNAAQGRILMNRTNAYSLITNGPHFAGYRDWVEYVSTNGVTGRWFAPPNTKRSEDEVVLYYIHGGGFVLDTAGNAQIWALALVKEMNLKKKIQFSIFMLDYELAPEFKYPSQLIESQAGYHHLVNTLGIAAEKICLSGDSAGGNIASAFLLHLARPNPAITVDEAVFGPVPGRPGAALLISPFNKLVSHLPSRTANAPYDYIETRSSFSAALDYIGAAHPSKRTFLPSFNPHHLVTSPYPPVPTGLISGAKYVADGKGLELFNSPYVNPSVCEDIAWWKEACPGDGRTCVVWGGKEIFCDEIVEFVDVLDRAGVAPRQLCKSKGAHDWILYDYVIPGVWKTNSKKDDARWDYGLNNVADFLQNLDLHVRSQARAAARASKVTASSSSSVVGTVDAVESEGLGESLVVVQDPVGADGEAGEIEKKERKTKADRRKGGSSGGK